MIFGLVHKDDGEERGLPQQRWVWQEGEGQPHSLRDLGSHKRGDSRPLDSKWKGGGNLQLIM